MGTRVSGAHIQIPKRVLGRQRGQLHRGVRADDHDGAVLAGAQRDSVRRGQPYLGFAVFIGIPGLPDPTS